MIQIDGSIGGGQVLRTALGLSVFTQKPFEIINIRAQRPQPGLKKQHLTCITTLQKLCNAEVTGAEVGSSHVTFVPKGISKHTLDVDIGSAGSITLLLQSILIPVLCAKKRIKLTIAGGTDVPWSMTYDYFKEVLIPNLAPFLKIQINLKKRGFYPKGQGYIEITMSPQEMIQLQHDYSTKGKLMSIKGVSYATTDLMDKSVAERQAKSARLFLGKLGCPVDLREEYCDSASTGSGVVVWGIYADYKDEISEHSLRIGGDYLGAQKRSSESVGHSAADRILHEVQGGATVDTFCADNLIPFIGIYGGTITTSRITDHIQSNCKVCSQFLEVTYNIDGGTNTIQVKEGFVE